MNINLYTRFEQLMQHPDDRTAFDQLQMRGLSSAEVVDRLARLLRNCLSRPDFIPSNATKDLLNTIKRDLKALEQSRTPAVSTRIAAYMTGQTNPLGIAYNETYAALKNGVDNIDRSHAEFVNWLSSSDAKDPAAVANFAKCLKEDPKKLFLFFETAITFPHWSLVNEQILSESYEQLAHFVSTRNIPEALARDLAHKMEKSHLEHITSIKCWVGQELFDLDKILLALKCRPEDLERHFISQEVILPEGIGRKGFVNLVDYLRLDYRCRGRLPAAADHAEMQSFVDALDFLGIDPDQFLLAESQQHHACMILHSLPGQKYEVTFKEPIAPEALNLLAIHPWCGHITKLNLSDVAVTDKLLTSMANTLPAISVLTFSYPENQAKLTEAGWNVLASFERLARVEMKVSNRDLQEAFSIADKFDRYQWTIKLPILSGKKLEDFTAKQLVHLNQLPASGNLAALNLLKDCKELKVLDFSKWFADNLTDAPLNALAGSFTHLTTLQLADRKKLSDSAIQGFISRSPQLREIDLSGTAVTDAAIELIVRTCPNLKALRLNGCQQITDRALQTLAKCHTLQSLHIANCPGVTSQAARYLAKETQFSLRELSLPYSLASGLPFQQICAANPNLYSLILPDQHLLSDEDALHLAQNCRLLVMVSIPGGASLTGQAIKALADHCSRLEVVSFDQCPGISTPFLYHLLEQCPNMQVLHLRGCHLIGNDSASNLARRFPHVLIYQPIQEASMHNAMIGPRNLR